MQLELFTWEELLNCFIDARSLFIKKANEFLELFNKTHQVSFWDLSESFLERARFMFRKYKLFWHSNYWCFHSSKVAV